MKKPLFSIIIFFIFLTSYTPKFSFNSNFKLNIEEITIKNNLILNSDEIKKKINFLYGKNLFFLNIKNIEESLKGIDFIESFTLKKIYPNKLKIIITEKVPIAILQNKKERFYISNKGSIIKFINQDFFYDLPTVFGNESTFFSLYEDLKNIKFPIKKIKSFYFFESGRWDLVMKDENIIKLPIKDYLFSIENYMDLKNEDNFNKYKIFDYRIKDQLILN